MRISTRRGVELICKAKMRGLPITASVTWLHPPLKYRIDRQLPSQFYTSLHPWATKSDRKALIAAIKEGIIDAIAIIVPIPTKKKPSLLQKHPPGANRV
jgi:dihydroorotase